MSDTDIAQTSKDREAFEDFQRTLFHKTTIQGVSLLFSIASPAGAERVLIMLEDSP
jgi:hypothetical protein